LVRRRSLRRLAEGLVVVLREVPDACLVAPAHLARVGRERVRLRLRVEALVAADGRAKERRLADAAPPDERDAVGAVHVEAHVVEDDLGTERLARPGDAQDVAAARLVELEADVGADEARALRALGVDDLLELLDLLQAALRLLALARVRTE